MAKLPRPAIVDFETLAIQWRPRYPPPPVGVSIKLPGKKSRYYAWGHPSGGNNCSFGEGQAALRTAWRSPDGVCFHSSKFDYDVALTHMEMPELPSQATHDTLYLLYLVDPHARTLELKPAAEKQLGLPPNEQEAVRDWLMEHQPLRRYGVKIGKGKQSDHPWGAYISLAPGDLVGRYAEGDTDRTGALFDLLYPKVVADGMWDAYDREQRVMRVLLRAEREGIAIDHEALEHDVGLYKGLQEDVDGWILKKLRAGPGLNLNSGDQVVAALLSAKLADTSLMGVTPTGKVSTSKEAIDAGVNDAQLKAMLRYRAALNTCTHTFMEPWLSMANSTGGRIHTTWNATRSASEKGGTRTGRLSSSPNFQNLANEFKPLFLEWVKDRGLFKAKSGGWLPPKAPIHLEPLPRVRRYITADEGEVLIDRDFSQQEPRTLAHFEGGALLDMYVNDPWTDVHDFAKAEIQNRTGRVYDRKPVKDINLGLIYGMGVGLLAEKTGLPVDETKELKKLVLLIYPGISDMYKEMRRMAKAGEPLRTWGGRLYYCEEPIYINGRRIEFDYKMVNTLVQGSAADEIKEAMLRYDERRIHGKFRLSVHDQLTASTLRAKKKLMEEMEILKSCMESVELDVPLLSEGKVGYNWADLKDYDAKGKFIWTGVI